MLQRQPPKTMFVEVTIHAKGGCVLSKSLKHSGGLEGPHEGSLEALLPGFNNPSTSMVGGRVRLLQN